MDKQDYQFNVTDDDTFALYSEGLNRLKLKVEQIDENKEENQTDLFSKAKNNLADLEYLLMQLKSTSEIEPVKVDMKMEVNNDILIEKPKYSEINFATNNPLVDYEVTKLKDDSSFKNKNDQEKFSIHQNLQEKEKIENEDLTDSKEDIKMNSNIELKFLDNNPEVKLDSRFEDVAVLNLENHIRRESLQNNLQYDNSVESNEYFEEIPEIQEENKTNIEKDIVAKDIADDDIENTKEKIIEDDIPELGEEITINTRKEMIEENKIVSDTNINEANPKHEIDESKEFKYLELCEVDLSREVKDTKNQSVFYREKENSDDNKMNNISNPFFYKTEKNNQVEEATPLIDENSVNKTFNEELEQVSVNNHNGQKKIIEGIALDKDDPNERLLMLIAQMEKEFKMNFPASKDTSLIENKTNNETKQISLFENIEKKDVQVNLGVDNKSLEITENKIHIQEAIILDNKPIMSEFLIESDIEQMANNNLSHKEKKDLIEVSDEIIDISKLIPKNEVLEDLKKENVEQNFSNDHTSEYKQLSYSFNLSISIDKKQTSPNKSSNELIQKKLEPPKIISQQMEVPNKFINEVSAFKQENLETNNEGKAKSEEFHDIKEISECSVKHEILETAKNSSPPQSLPVENNAELIERIVQNYNYNYTHGSHIKTPFDDDNEIEEIPEIKIDNFKVEEAKFESSGIVNYLRPSEPRESQSNKNPNQSKKFDIIDLIDMNQSKFENLSSNKNFDNFDKNSNFSRALNDNNQQVNNFYNTKSNAYMNDPFLLNKSEYSIANSFLVKEEADIIKKVPEPEMDKGNLQMMPPTRQQSEKNTFPLPQNKASGYFIIDNSGINYNEKSEQIDFDVKDIASIPDQIQTVPEITETDYKKDKDSPNKFEDFHGNDSNLKFSNFDEIKISNYPNNNSKIESIIDFNKKAEIGNRYFHDNPDEIDVDDYQDYEEIHNLTGKNFKKDEAKNICKNKKNSLKYDNKKLTNPINNIKKKDSFNISKDKITTHSVSKDFTNVQNKYQNFATEEYDSNNILVKLNTEPISVSEKEQHVVPARNLMTNIIPIPAPKDNTNINNTKIEEKPVDELKFKSKNSMTSVSYKNMIEDTSKSRKNSKEISKRKTWNEFNLLTNFNIIERKFNENIPNFASIFGEKNYIYKRRRNSILKNSYYQEHILKENNIIDRYKSIPRDFPLILEESLKKFEQSTDFQSIFDDALKYPRKKQELIERLRKDKKENPLIGDLIPITIYLDLYELDTAESKKSFGALREEISYWRQCECDGDSFYRVFMFGLLEEYILSKKISEIKKILLDICNVNNFNSENNINTPDKIDLTKVLLIFYMILNYLDKNKINEAYEVLVKSYDIANDFDTKLVDYMRRILWMNLFEMEKEIIKENNKKLEYDPIRIDPILVTQNEPNKLPISLVPLIFDVNLDIYIFDGSLGKSNNITYLKQSFTNYKPQSSSNPTITLFYNMSSYHKIYKKDFTQRHKDILNPLLMRDFTPNISYENQRHCDLCNLKTDHAVFKKYSNYIFCVECAQKYVNQAIDKRAKIYSIENFHNREYYSRGFELNKNIFLNDSDIFKIHYTNIANLLQMSIKKFCFFCHTKHEEKIHTLPCYCQICETCLGQILKIFDSLKLSANKKKAISKPLCSCNSTFDKEAGLKLINSSGKNIPSFELKDKIQGLDDYASRYCMKCCNMMIKKGDEMNIASSNDFYHKFRIVHEETLRTGKDYSYVPHVLCNSCIEKILKIESEENLRKRKLGLKKTNGKDYKMLECNFCKCNHKIMISEWNKMYKGSSCCDRCSIM